VVHGSVTAAELTALGLAARDVLDFSVNTNPLGPAASVLQAVRETDWSRYPGDDEEPLRRCLAERAEVAPEQVAHQPVTEAADWYAFGVILFELLTGRVPFEAETILELCFKVAQEKAPNPKTLRGDLRHLLDGYRPVHLARKVVGIGSVGTRSWVALLLGRDGNDPLFLQIKEAGRSVLEHKQLRYRRSADPGVAQGASDFSPPARDEAPRADTAGLPPHGEPDRPGPSAPIETPTDENEDDDA